MKKKHKYVWVSVPCIFLAALLASCAIGAQTEATVLVATPEVSKTAASQPTPSATEESAPEESPTAEIIVDRSTALPPTPRPGLEASDPDLFIQASGQVQLVEFFAFW